MWAWIIILTLFEDTFINPLLRNSLDHPIPKVPQYFPTPKETHELPSMGPDRSSDFSASSRIKNKGFRWDFGAEDVTSNHVPILWTPSPYKFNAHQGVHSSKFQLLINNLPNVLILGPTKSKLVTSPFSRRRYHPILGKMLPHKGIDVGAPEGTPVMAVADGQIAFVGKKPKSGRIIKIFHGDSKESRYLHLAGFSSLAEVGRKVFAGDVIGYVGQSGLTTGPHLHFEVWINGKAVAPSGHHITELAPPKPLLWKCYERLVYQVLYAGRFAAHNITERQNKRSLVEMTLLSTVTI
jgi:murein DD-endopeptidase MepM/ murein hydrolase activator NlpD